MDKNIKVSVIIPIYNSKKFLNRCLDSIVNQTLKEIEIICINDGSTDKSEEIVKSYNDERIVLISQENSGISVTRNRGMAIARGEYIGFVDSDDWLDLDFYEKLYEAAKKNDADIATAGIIRLHKWHKKFYIKFTQETVTNDIKQKVDLCEYPNKSYVWNKIYKTNKLQEHNLKFEEGRIYEDIIFTPQALYYLDKMVTVPDTYYYYWRSSNSTVTKKDEKSKQDLIYATQISENFIKEHNIDTSAHKAETKRFKFLGLTIFKIKTKNKNIEYNLFNIIKWYKKGS